MLEIFQKKFKWERLINDTDSSVNTNQWLLNYFKEVGWYSFNEGLYRIHTSQTSILWKGIIEEVFPEYKNIIEPIWFDWLGRQYTLDKRRLDNEWNQMILLFQIYTWDVFEVPYSVNNFYNIELIEHWNILLEPNILKKSLWNKKLKFTECVWYKKPLFLWGKHEFWNMEIIDMKFYWEFTWELWNMVKDLPDWTEIGNISIK